LCVESPFSRDGSKGFTGGPVTREFTVLHEPDLDAAVALVEAAADVEFEGRERKNITWRSLGYDLWLFTVTYGSGAGNDGLRPDQFGFRVTSQQTRINQSFETLYRLAPATVTGTNLTASGISDLIVTPDGHSVTGADVGRVVRVTGGAGWVVGAYTITAIAGGTTWVLDAAPAGLSTAGGLWQLLATAPDCKGAIGQDKDSVKGTDVVVPGGEFSLVQRRPTFTLADYRLLKSLVGKVTDREFLGFPAGAVMYLGAEPVGSEGTLQNGQPVAWWALAHQFRDEEARRNVVVGDIVIPLVPPFAHVWATYGPDVPAGADRLAVKPTAVYVERVTETFNPDLLGGF
jgi:hypothetical protein